MPWHYALKYVARSINVRRREQTRRREIRSCLNCTKWRSSTISNIEEHLFATAMWRYVQMFALKIGNRPTSFRLTD
jgi:hypothetical protein